MQPSQRLDQRLHMTSTRDELQTMSEGEERGEQVWRVKLLRCQRQLKAKEEELSRQSHYFQNFKMQLQRKLSVSRDREQSLLSRIYALENQLLDMTVSAATGMATMKAARITAGTVTYLEEQERGEGEGEEAAKEDRKRQWRPSVGNESDAEESRNMDITNGARLQSFIISLQEDLRVLLEREEQWMTEQRRLTEQLQEAQERSSFLGCRAEEMKAEVQQLRLSENCWMEEVEDVREENQQLQQLLRESSSSVISMESSSARSSGKVSSGEKLVPVGHHQAAVESTESPGGPTKTSLPFTTEIVDEFKMGNMSLEEAPSEESDALLHAYKSLGLGDEAQALQEQHGEVKVSLEENSSHKTHPSHLLQASFCQDDPSPTQDDLVYALNQENRALADRIQELLYHMELRQEETPKEKTHLREEIKRLQENEVKLEQTNQEQAGLISELTKKTEDDLNAIMELQQKMAEIKDLQYLQDCKGPGSASGTLHSDQCFRSLEGNSPFNQETFDSIQSLKTQQEELSASVKSFKEQQREVSQSVRAQTEEKQQLTRDIWVLKEEKDSISRSVAELKLEKEKLSRTVCGLRDERKQFTKSMSRLKEEEEHMKKTLSALDRDKEEMKKCLSTESEKRDQIIQSMQSLETESDELNRSVLHLKEERDKLSEDLTCVKEQRDQEIRYDSLKEDHLIHSVSRWREGKEKQEVLIFQGLRKQKESLQSVALQIQSEEISSERTPAGPTEERSDVRRTDEALKEALKKLQAEFDQKHTEAKQLQSELLESESRREEAERRAAHAAEKVTRLTVDTCLMEDVKRENNSLADQVMELQSTVSALLRQKSEALSLKDQTEEQHRVLSAQLKAKTEALQELNSEYVALKRRRVSESVEEEVLVSLRTRYNDIRSKYDALLKRKSQTDFEAAPLKAKLSCLVLKCRERNELLAQMMKVMHRRGCVDSQLSQQVERLLSDAALREYTTAFTPGNHTHTQHNHTGYTTQLLATLQGCTLGSTSLHEQDKDKVRAGPAESCFTSEKCCHHLRAVAPEASPLSVKSAVPTSSMQEPDTVQPSSLSINEHVTPNAAQVSLSGGQSPRNGFHHSQDKCHPVSACNPASPSSSTRVSPSRGLSSPEKILSLHEQLQQTVMSSYQLSETQREEEWTGRTRPVSASAELHRTNEQNHSLNSTTLFNAVVSRSATLTTSRFINHSTSTTTSDTSPRGPRNTDVITAVHELSEAPGNTITDGEATSSDSAALNAQRLKDGDVCVSNSLVRRSKHTQCIHGSLKRSNKSTRKFSDALDMRKSARHKSEAPAEVSCVEVINTVGQSSVLIGWERPPLDELGCSNGTFVYGYRVFVDGNFHKSVLSSACTKCVLENVDLSLPVQISVQTLGLNGLTSNSVHTMYTQCTHNNVSYSVTKM